MEGIYEATVRIKLLLDVSMTVLYLLLMFAKGLGSFFHEAVGIGIGVLFLSDVVLTVCMPIVIVTGALIARELFTIDTGLPWMTLFSLHNTLSYVCLGAMALHLLVYAALAAFRHTTPEPVVTVSPTLSPAPSPTLTAAPSPTEEAEETVSPLPETTPPSPTLAEFFTGLRCSGCGKHCPLSHPRCGRGELQARQATEEYYQTYGE